MSIRDFTNHTRTSAMTTRTLVLALSLNLAVGAAATVFAASPTGARADDPAPCQDEKCHGVNSCVAGAGMTCRKDIFETGSCYTDLCGGSEE
jgi:uncharacterized membrane protein